MQNSSKVFGKTVGLEFGKQEFEISHIFGHSAYRWRQGCQPYVQATFYRQEYSWYSFLLEAESTPGPYCSWKDWVNLRNAPHPALQPATFWLVA
jgi:hypothetical protein